MPCGSVPYPGMDVKQPFTREEVRVASFQSSPSEGEG